MSDSKRRVSNRTVKRKSAAEEKNVVSKKVRPCDKAGCSDIEPSCCLLSCDSCTESGYTSRWYHMSLGEHFCNNCFDNLYRPGRTGNLHFNEWSNKWSLVARVSKPAIKRYVANELLPFWVKCTIADCGKWRMVQKEKDDVLVPEFVRNFNCLSTDSKSCDTVEDKLVALASNPYFTDQLTEAPLLKNSPAEPYLKRFLPEDVGMCPNDSTISSSDKIKNIEPFSINQCGEASIWPKPDSMDDDEMLFVSNTLISSATYLGIRNLIVALWNLSPKEWLDMQKVNIHLICRGLVRINLMSLADLVLKLLTRKSVINYGIIDNPWLESMGSSDNEVLIVGAGISGLAAGRHLHNLGVKVTIYEAGSDLGGRIKDDSLAAKAYVIRGILNNPFRILTSQSEEMCQELKKSTVIFDADGKRVPEEIWQKVDQLLRGTVHGAFEQAYQNNNDSNWYDMVTDNFNKFISGTHISCDSQLFNHLFRLLEMQMEVNLNNLSILNWESIIALKGVSAIIPSGIKHLLKKLAENLNITYNEEVKSVDYSGDEVRVVSSSGESVYSKVLLTVPVSLLRDEKITFTPPLPYFKHKAFFQLGDYYCAKLILQFSKQFWRGNSEKYKQFSIISSEQVFELFLDVTEVKKNAIPTLVAILSPRALEVLEDKSEEDIVEICMKVLKGTFSKKRNVPSPTKWHLTDRKKSNCNSYSTYVKVDGKISAFDDMAKTIDNKIYFAGEATFRNIPGCMTGAYLSGLREASKIVDNLELF